MALEPPLSSLPIKTAESGFYRGFSIDVTVTSKIVIGALILWAVIFPEASGRILNQFNGFILSNFATWYVYVMAGFVLVCLGLAAIYLFGRSGIVYALDGARIAGTVAVAGGAATIWLARRQPAAAVAALLAVLVAVNWTLVLRVLPGFERYKPVVPLSAAVLAHARAGDIVVHYDVALPSMVFYLQRHIDMTYAPEAFLEKMRSGSGVLAVLAEDRYEALRRELPPTCVVARQETFDAKLKELIVPRTPPAILLISTRCPP